MIKCFWFWKLLKQLFIISLISCFGFCLNYSDSWYIQQVWIDSVPSYYNNDYDLSFLKWGGLLTQFIYQGKWLLAFNNYAYFWWSPNWQPYFYDSLHAQNQDQSFQWFFNQYYLCDYFSWNTNQVPIGCVSYPMTWDYKEMFSSFFSRVNQWDYVFYEYEPMDFGSTYYDNTVQVCWSSQEVNKSLCFRQHSCYNGRGCSAYNYWSLIDSQWIAWLRGYLSIPNSWLGYAPWNCLYNGWSCSSDWIWSDNTWPVAVDDNVSILSWSYVYKTCTNESVLLKLYDLWYSVDLCAWGVDSWDNWWTWALVLSLNAQPWYWKTLEEIYNYTAVSWQSYISWFNYFNNYYQNSSVVSQDFWSNYPFVLRNWYSYYYQYWWNMLWFENVYNYCSLLNNTDNFTLQNQYTWTYFAWVCLSLNSSNINNPYNVWSWVAVWVSWDWIRTWNVENYTDAVVFIQDFFNMLKSNFPTKYDIWVGFLPVYIITFMLALMLFRFLRH